MDVSPQQNNWHKLLCGYEFIVKPIDTSSFWLFLFVIEMSDLQQQAYQLCFLCFRAPRVSFCAHFGSIYPSIFNSVTLDLGVLEIYC